MARLSVSQPLEKRRMQTDRHTLRQEDGEQCLHLYKDRVGGRLLSGKESWSTRKRQTVQREWRLIVRQAWVQAGEQKERQADR